MKKTLALLTALIIALTALPLPAGAAEPVIAVTINELDPNYPEESVYVEPISNYSDTSSDTKPYQYQLTATVTSDDLVIDTSSYGSSKLEWSSDNTDIASVDENGLVTGLAAGTASITASYLGTKSDPIIIEVSGIVFESLEYRIMQGQTQTLSLKKYGEAKNIASLSWNCTSADTSIVVINPGGYTTPNAVACGLGTTTVTCASSATDLYSASCTVTVYSNSANAINATLVDNKLSFSDISSSISSACTLATGGEKLDYITNLSVSTEQGTLYYDYVSAGDTGMGVSSSASYYYSSSGAGYLLSRVTFVLKAGYVGDVVIYYTGFTTSDPPTSYSGEIHITANKPTGVSYASDNGEVIYFSADDFETYCEATYGRTLRYVSFTVPSSAYGILYKNYNNGAVYETNISSGDKFYRISSPNISDVAFIPADGYNGSFYIYYTASDSAGSTYTGYVTITVSNNEASESSSAEVTASGTITYYCSQMGVKFKSSDFFSASGSLLPDGVTSIHITTPPALTTGKLYTSYDSPSSSTELDYSQDIALADISSVIFIPKAGFTGTAQITYTARDRVGNTCGSVIKIVVSQTSSSSYFQDMYGCEWAIPYVDFLYNYGIVHGTSLNNFNPNGEMKRCDFVLMLYNALPLPYAGTASFTDVPETSYYAVAAAAAKAAGIVSGNPDGTFSPESPITRQDAALLLYKCINYFGSVEGGNVQELYDYKDYSQISSYALEALSALVDNGLIVGNGYGWLMPKSTVTRAQAAVMINKMIT